MYTIKDVNEIVKPLIQENFPNFDGLRTSSRSGRIVIDVRIPESEYIADLLTSEMSFEDIADRVLEKLYNLGCHSVEVRKAPSIKEFSFNRSAVLAC